MFAILSTAMLLGMLGSLHCVGMCGPLALSVPVKNDTVKARIYGSLLYNMGRVVTYSFFGGIIGVFGQTLSLIGFQQWLSIIAGLLILVFFIFNKKGSQKQRDLFPGFYEKINTQLSKLYFQKSRSSVFFIGMLNGLLPCGFVYFAITGALATGSLPKSIVFMAAFGMGTLPLMWSLVFFGRYFSANLSRNIRKAYPYLMMTTAFLLIIRGMGLGIPYLSPAFEIKNTIVHSCCHK